MVETSLGRPGRMAFKTGLAVIGIPSDSIMIFIGFTLLMARDAGENGIIAGILVTVGTSIPFSLVFSGINGEKLSIMVKSSWCPGRFAMT